MEPLSLAALVVTALTTFATGLAAGAAERALATGGRLVDAIRTHLSDEADTLDLVDEVTSTPTESAQERLTLRLARRIAVDPEFAEALDRALREDGPGRTVEASDAGVVAGGDVRLQGRYVAGRDLSIGGPGHDADDGDGD